MEADMNRLLKQWEELTKRKEKVIRKREQLAREELEREDEGTPTRRRARRPTKRGGIRPRGQVPPKPRRRRCPTGRAPSWEYETQRQVLVRSWRVGVVCRIIQLGVLAYIIG
ncbi:hypothetical protein CRUP_017472 [Coryphaenoides rupestris]|nr:hypothetical protein CRUP_017472 [Coryphaenoides rupestris]